MFPTLRSIFQAEALEETLRRTYDLRVTRCALLKPRLSDIYRVDTQEGPFVLRVYPTGLNLARWISAEVDILDGLRAAGLPVSTAVRQAGGDALLALAAPEGERYAVLYTYAHGRSLKRNSNAEHFRACGRLAAQMHLAAARIPAAAARTPLDAYTLLAHPLEALGAAFPERTTDLDVLHEAADAVGAVMENLGAANAVWGFCHGDLNFSHVHATADGSLTLFDFEFCGPGWPAYDIATVMNFEARDPAKAFLEGYESQRPLHPRERAALGWFQIANRLWMLGTAARLRGVFGSQVVTDELLESAVEYVQEKMAALRGTNRA